MENCLNALVGFGIHAVRTLVAIAVTGAGQSHSDEHIRRYANLLEARKVQSPQIAVIESKRADGRGHRPKSTAREIADATGLSDDTVRRALNPKPREIVSVKEAETDEEAIIREANAIVAARQ